MLPNFFQKLFPDLIRPELAKISVNLTSTNQLEIITPLLLPATSIGELLYKLYNKFNYLFNYLDYQIKISENNLNKKRAVRFQKPCLHVL